MHFFFFSYYTAVSGTSLYQSWVYTGFNFILGLPIIFYGFLDRDISDTFALAHPQVPSIPINQAFVLLIFVINRFTAQDEQMYT